MPPTFESLQLQEKKVEVSRKPVEDGFGNVRAVWGAAHATPAENRRSTSIQLCEIGRTRIYSQKAARVFVVIMENPAVGQRLSHSAIVSSAGLAGEDQIGSSETARSRQLLWHA